MMRKLLYLQASTPVKKFIALIRGFYGLKVLPNFFVKQMSSFFKTLIEHGSTLVYNNDILLLSNYKEH